jgi:hypothetical protein
MSPNLERALSSLPARALEKASLAGAPGSTIVGGAAVLVFPERPVRRDVDGLTALIGIDSISASEEPVPCSLTH